MKYNKKGTKVRGSLLLIRHLADGSKYRIKSNALYGLSVGEANDGEPFGWASFSGKCTYLEPGWAEPVGAHEFITYVEDRGEPGKDVDRIWLRTLDRGGNGTDLSMDQPAPSNAVTISGGNIVVPHTNGK